MEPAFSGALGDKLKSSGGKAHLFHIRLTSLTFDEIFGRYSEFKPRELSNAKKVAVITGITGQDGSYLAEFLLEKGYIVHGIRRRASLFNTDRIDHLYQDPHVAGARLFLHYGDLSDSSSLTRIIQQTQPDEIYNLGVECHPELTP